MLVGLVLRTGDDVDAISPVCAHMTAAVWGNRVTIRLPNGTSTMVVPVAAQWRWWWRTNDTPMSERRARCQWARSGVRG
jgi:hypothetical protein